MNLQSTLNKNSPWAHMESKLDVLGVTGKFVNYIIHLSKKKIEFFFFSPHMLPKQRKKTKSD
jgi:hypothetical protein